MNRRERFRQQILSQNNKEDSEKVAKEWLRTCLEVNSSFVSEILSNIHQRQHNITQQLTFEKP